MSVGTNSFAVNKLGTLRSTPLWRNGLIQLLRLSSAVAITTVFLGAAAPVNRILAEEEAESSSFAGPDISQPDSDKERQRVSHAESINVDGVTRTFLLYVPRTYNSGTGALLIALHGRGAGGPGSAMEQYSHLDENAERAGYAVAYLDALPDATGALNWNYFYDPFFVNPPDDVSKKIDLLESRLSPNERRIYVTGISVGGFMAQRVGVELSDRIAAIGVVEGNLYVTTPSSPRSVPHVSALISVLLLKGDQDPNNQYCGAVFRSFGIVEASADQDFDYWSGPQADKCALIRPSAPLCESVGVGDAQGSVTPGTPTKEVIKQALVCRQNTEVRLIRLIGGQDIWNLNRLNIPGQIPFNPHLSFITGVHTNSILFRFFEEHPKGELVLR